MSDYVIYDYVKCSDSGSQSDSDLFEVYLTVGIRRNVSSVITNQVEVGDDKRERVLALTCRQAPAAAAQVPRQQRRAMGTAEPR